jgi:competence protein ComEC
MAKKKKNSSDIKIRVGRRKVKAPWWVFLIILIIAAVAVGGYFVYYAMKPATGSKSSTDSALTSSLTSSPEPSSTYTSISGDSDPISFHFVSQNNAHTGDCTYIKAGNNDILIDAGNKTGSAAVIEKYLEDSTRGSDYVSDKKLEYVVATHAHQDHIAGFVGNSSTSEAGGKDGIFYHYTIDNLLDFSYFDGAVAGKYTLVDNSLTSTSTPVTTIYKNYLAARNYAIGNGTKWQTAGQMWKSASHTITLGKNLSMTLLYSYFYDHVKADMSGLGDFDFSDQNDDSVCVLFTQGNKHFLFTGDSEAAGEYSLTKYNTLPEVELFKGGHHGSYTANTDALLSVIKPKMVCICCCAGNTEYASLNSHTFPAQESINRIAPYTDRVYVTDLGSFTDSSYVEPMNGNIVVSYDAASNESLSCSHNSLKLKETDWFKANRTMPSAWA